VRPFLNDLAVIQHQDAVGHPYRAEAMGDNKGGAALHQPLQSLLHQRLGLAVE